MEVLAAAAFTAMLGLLAWNLKETKRMSERLAKIQFALFGDGEVPERESILPLINAVAELHHRVKKHDRNLEELFSALCSRKEQEDLGVESRGIG